MSWSTLTPAAIRHLYLAGIDLGTAWGSAAGNAAIAQLLTIQQAKAQRILGVSLCGTRVRTMPDSGQVLGTDYEMESPLVSYGPPTGTPPIYSVPVRFNHIRSLDRVRVFQGYSTATPPVALFETVAANQTLLLPLDRRVQIAAAGVTQPNLAMGWALDYTYGVGTIPYEVAEWMALGTAIQVLSVAGAGQDITHGLGAESLTQDGMTESYTYPQHELGPYGGVIQILTQRQRDIDLQKLRMHLQ